MNLREMRTELVALLGDVQEDRAVVLKANAILNRACRQFLAEATWYFANRTATLSFQENVKEYALPATVLRLNELEVRLQTSWKALGFVSEREFPYVIPTPTVRGVPKFFTLRGFQAIQFYPIPSEIALTEQVGVDYEYQLRHVTLAEDTDESIILDEFMDPVLNKAEEIYRRLAGQDNLAALAGNRYQASLEAAFEANRKVVGAAGRDIVKDQPTDQGQDRGIDQRRV